MEEKPIILIVDDDKSTRKTLALILGKKGYETETAGTGRQAIAKVKRTFFDVVLLDIKLPDREGTNLLAPFKKVHPDMDVIIVTGYASLENTRQALNGGASAYITKPLDIDELLATIRKVYEKRCQLIEEKKIYQEAQRELAERKQEEEKLVYMATHDGLTGLPNRALFNDRLTQQLAHAQRWKRKLAVMLLDLDYFKNINDTLGHKGGDKLLQRVGKRLIGILRESDTIARMGGDEFLLLLPEIARVKDVLRLAHKILEVIRKPFIFDGHRLNVTTSIGIAVSANGSEDAETIVDNADMAMYSAKRKGRDNYQCHAGK